jgi:hypothetical protein
MCGQRAAVVERNSRAHQEKVGEAVLRYLHGTRSEAVHGIGLVVGAHHQTCEGELHALGGIALEYEGVQGVECERGFWLKITVGATCENRPPFGAFALT